jgi:hypothetical protein
MPVPIKVRGPRPPVPGVSPVVSPRLPGTRNALEPGPADVVRARTQVGNAAVNAALGGLPRGAGLAPSGWTARMLLAGQALVGNQAVASQGAATSPTAAGSVRARLAGAPVTPVSGRAAPRKPVGPQATAPSAAVPGQKDLAARGKSATERPEKEKAAGPRSPGADPKFQALEKDVTAKKKAIGSSHPPAPAEAGAAQAAAEPPADDREARGKAAHAEDMDAAQPKEFDKQAFIDAVKKAVADKAPKNLDEADKFGESGKAEEVKTEAQGKVGEGRDASAQEIADTTAAVPQPAPDAKQVAPMAADKVPGKPGTPNPAQAAPDPLPESATDMSAGPEQVDQQMAEAQVTDQQLSFKNSREPGFDKAVREKKTMETHSATAPKKLRAGESRELEDVKAVAATRGATAMAGIHATRVTTGKQVGAGKTGAKTRDEDRRKQVTALLQQVFDQTKCDVEKILTDLDKKVDDQFTTDEKRARDRFTTEHEGGMRRYKDERYGGVFGWARWTKDLFAGLPDEANRIYEHAKDNYLTAMNRIISDIADTVERELRRAKDRITAGRTELKAAVDKLPADLKAIGREAAQEFEGRFDELKDTVNDKGTELVDTLATKYTDAVKSVDDEIAAEKEKNKGLVAKAAEAIGGAIKAIIELGRMLMGVLRKAVTAIGAILKDPIGFLGNLVTGVGGGLKLFMRNAGRHLEQGVLAWLLGTAATAGLRLPTSFDILGILLMIATVLGLTWANIRSRLVRKVPEKAVVAAETAVPLVAQVKRRGVAGMWDDLKSRVGDLKKDLISNLVSYLLPTIIIAGITWIVSLFNPASAFIRACKMIIDIIRFVVTNARQIIDFVNAVLDAVIAIARGGTGGVPALVERALARAIPVLIGALAALLGIGGIAGKVRQIFQKLARPVNRAVDWVITKIVGLVKKLWAKLKAKLARKKPRRRKPLIKRARDRLRGGDDTPAGQRKRLAAALAAGVSAVNRFRGRPVAGKILQPLLMAIRLRYGLDTLHPVVKGDHWAVFGRINPESTRDSDAKVEGDQETGANPNFTEDAKAFEQKLAAKAATHRASNSALAVMARKAKAYIAKKAGAEWDRKGYLMRKKAREAAKVAPVPVDAVLEAILDNIGTERLTLVGSVGEKTEDVMAVFDSGTLTERFFGIMEFLTNVLGRDLMDANAEAKVEEYIVHSDLNLVYLSAIRVRMRDQRMDPTAPMSIRERTRAIAPLPEGGILETVEGQDPPARVRRPAGVSRELGLTLAETGFRFSARQVRAQQQLDPNWDRSKPLRWSAGAKEWMVGQQNEWAQEQLRFSLPLGAGPSGSTNTLMRAAEIFGADPDATRLACIAFFVGAQHHTLIEVMIAAGPFASPYLPGEKLYRRIDPLSEATLRACGKNGKFPDEAPEGKP